MRLSIIWRITEIKEDVIPRAAATWGNDISLKENLPGDRREKNVLWKKKQKKAAYFLSQLLNECHLSLQSSSAVAYHVIKDLPIQQGLHATHQTLLLHHQDEDLPSNSVLVLYQLLLSQKTASAADCKNKALWDYFITYLYT